MSPPDSLTIFESLPVWIQVWANVGALILTFVAAFYGFVRKISAISHVGDNHPDPIAILRDTYSAVHDLTEVMKQFANTSQSILTLMQEHERNAEIEREVARRLAERIPREI